MNDRYSRQEIIPEIGKKGQQKLKKSKITIIGVGAIGTVTAELLTRAGIGNITLFDKDIVELNNLQRQTLYQENDVGKAKSLVAAKKLQKINSTIKIKGYNTEINSKNITKIKSDIILDCTDNMETKFLINDYCSKEKIPWIYASAIKNIGTIINFFTNKKCLNCAINFTSKLKTCQEIGVLNSTTTIIAAIQASEAIKQITQQKTSDEMMRINLTNNDIKKIKYSQNKNCKTCNKNYVHLNKTPVKITKTCNSYHIKGLEKPKKTLKDKNITIFTDGRAIIKARNKKEAQKIYQETIFSN